MSNIEDVYNVSMAGIQSGMIEEEANFRKASINGDFDEQVRASQSLASLKSLHASYHSMASEHAASLQQTKVNRFGLTEDEENVARKAFTATVPANLSPQERDDFMDATYAKNKQKLQKMRASGEYPNSERN